MLLTIQFWVVYILGVPQLKEHSIIHEEAMFHETFLCTWKYKSDLRRGHA